MAIDLVPEAEVSLRLAIHLVTCQLVQSDVSVALDGAQIKTGDIRHFDVPAFMQAHGWTQDDGSLQWRGAYRCSSCKWAIEVHSRSGCGDVTATLISGALLIAEAKKGRLQRCKSSSEYPLLREAIGQLMTLEVVPENAVLAVAVPHGEKFAELTERWRRAPLLQRAGIRLLTVARTGEVFGW